MGLTDRHAPHINAGRQFIPTPIDGLLRLPLQLDGQQILSNGVHGRHIVGSLSLRIFDGGVGTELIYQGLDAGLGLGGVGSQ